MIEGQRMTVADVVAQVGDGRLEDFVREAVQVVAREIMEAEVSGQVGAQRGEVAPEARVTYRNGYRPRPWETRVGEIELLVPPHAAGQLLPQLLGAAAAFGAGDRRGRDGGVCQRGLDAEG